MSAAKHTPGPWEVAGGYIRTRFDGRNGGFSIARVEALNDERDANAAVLAAAPDLLAVAKLSAGALCLSGIEPDAHGEDEIAWLLHQTEAAIAKATGGAG